MERAFRSIKTVDLEIRPVFHWTAPRVRARVFLCMLAHYVEFHMRRRLAPILFDDHDRAAAAAERELIVAPAKRSPAAMRKATSRRTDDGMPVHSFRSLLADLATLALNKVSLPSNQKYRFDLPTEPTPLQARALELLGVARFGHWASGRAGRRGWRRRWRPFARRWRNARASGRRSGSSARPKPINEPGLGRTMLSALYAFCRTGGSPRALMTRRSGCGT